MLIKKENIADILVVSADLINAKRGEILELEEELKNSPLFKKLEEAKKELTFLEKERENRKGEVIKFMLDNGLKTVSNDTFKISIKNNGRDSVVIIDETEIPEEFFRVKKEVDKSKILKEYRECGVLVQGVDIQKTEKYILDIKCLD